MTSRKGTIRQKINQMSMNFMSEVGGSSSILLVKMVVITSMMVRLTAMTSPNRSLSKKMVTKVMRSRRTVTLEEPVAAVAGVSHRETQIRR